MTEKTRLIGALIDQKKYAEAEKLLPQERIYPVNEKIKKSLGMM